MKHCEPSQPAVLWREFWSSLCDDLPHALRLKGFVNLPVEDVYDFGLFLLDGILHDMGTALHNFPDMPHVRRPWLSSVDNPYIAEHLSYDVELKNTIADQGFAKFNDDQHQAYHKILLSIERQDGSIFFVNGPGGTGKTFLYNTLCHRIRGNHGIALCVASSGIAALLLPGGRTAHSTFAIPVQDLAEDSFCQIDKHSKHANLFRLATVLIWDEAAMQHR
ncbi:PIF1-like helicase-domain-containing protein [Russula brevipes]|nr:PIF1-like helicase-domain-containing protein [Russula brevipes]